MDVQLMSKVEIEKNVIKGWLVEYEFHLHIEKSFQN